MSDPSTPEATGYDPVIYAKVSGSVDDVFEDAVTQDDNPIMHVDEAPVDRETVDGNDSKLNVVFTDSTKEEECKLSVSSGLADGSVHDLPFESHFTVRTPTSTLQYRGRLLRVIDTDYDQIILSKVKEDNKEKIIVKRISPGTLSHKILRISYTLVTVLFCGFLFVFCFQVLLLLIIAVQVYSTEKVGQLGQISTITMISTLLAFPMMLYSMSSLMAMGSAFVMDTWRGGTLFRSKRGEIISMFVFLVAPISTLMICLMIQYDEAWRMTAGVWCALVLVTFCSWALAVTIQEVGTCFWLVEKLYYSAPEGGKEDKWTKLRTIAKIAFMKSQMARYSGTRKLRYHVAGSDIVAGDEDNGFCSSDDYMPVESKTGLYSRLTELSCCSSKLKWFKPLKPPKRVWKSNDLLETPSIVTKNNWTMERMWCGGTDRHHTVCVADGPYALTPAQVKYTGLCTVLGSTLSALLLIGFLCWMEMGPGTYLIVGVLATICIIYPLGKQSYELHQMYESVNRNRHRAYSRRNVTTASGSTLFQVWETVRITQPRESYCIVRAVLEVSILFLWPFICMLVLHNWPVAVVFFVMSVSSLIWRYFDSTAAMMEYGTLSKIKDKDLDHSKKYFFTRVGQDVINNQGRGIWSSIFVVLFLAIVFLFLTAQKSSEEVMPADRGPRPPVLLIDDFYYPPTNDTLAYPTCKLTKGFDFTTETNPDEVESALLGDYAFLSAMAYETSSITEYSIDKWLGQSNMVVDEEDLVRKWRQESGTAASPVYFKLFSVNPNPKYAIMSIRGSETSYDWIVNMQLWSSAGLSQVIKWLTPFGWIWTPILPDLIKVISFVESRAIRDVAYYKVTTKFVNDILSGYADKGIEKIYVTGASLGGGLAVITGAQTEAYTVAISGLGAKLSRRMFDPPIELDALNDHTFNYIPERDYIARIGGRQKLFQNAECGAPKNNLFACHSMWRSVCEINYRCGTNGRPVVCKCVTQFGYPVPVRNENSTRTFEEACEEAEVEWKTMFPIAESINY